MHDIKLIMTLSRTESYDSMIYGRANNESKTKTFDQCQADIFRYILQFYLALFFQSGLFSDDNEIMFLLVHLPSTKIIDAW